MSLGLSSPPLFFQSYVSPYHERLHFNHRLLFPTIRFIRPYLNYLPFVAMNSVQNRPCSFLFSKCGTFVICHSALHRSTFRLSSTATITIFAKNRLFPYERPFKSCREAFFLSQYWLRQEREAVDCFIESIEAGNRLNDIEEACFQVSRPTWKVTKLKTKTGIVLIATRPSGNLEERVAAGTFRHLHARTN